MPRHSWSEMRVMQCMTYFFCASLQFCRRISFTKHFYFKGRIPCEIKKQWWWTNPPATAFQHYMTRNMTRTQKVLLNKGFLTADNRTWTCTLSDQNLNLARLPIPPYPHKFQTAYCCKYLSHRYVISWYDKDASKLDTSWWSIGDSNPGQLD